MLAPPPPAERGVFCAPQAGAPNCPLVADLYAPMRPIPELRRYALMPEAGIRPGANSPTALVSRYAPPPIATILASFAPITILVINDNPSTAPSRVAYLPMVEPVNEIGRKRDKNPSSTGVPTNPTPA